MKTLIAIALVVGANSAVAGGFSPWSAASAAPQTIDANQRVVSDTGFGPWRARDVVDEYRSVKNTKIVISRDSVNIFRPWS